MITGIYMYLCTLTIDTPSSIGPDICVVNLGSPTVMTLSRISGIDSGDDIQDESFRIGTKKHLFLPRRSALILSGEARYCWSHSIAQRKSDKVNGTLIQRSTRISLTFRQIVAPSTDMPASALKDSELEKDHVFRVYDNIAGERLPVLTDGDLNAYNQMCITCVCVSSLESYSRAPQSLLAPS
jgi:2OG-Fe(II) oxygenase superfamily